MTPPIVVPCPPMNFVSEWTTMSAPYSIGRSRIGVATVLSTISGTPCLWAILASASMSQMFPAGLPTLSQYTAPVLSSISASIDLGLSSLSRSGPDADSWKDMREQRVRRAVQLGNGHDVRAGGRDVERREVQRRLPGRNAERLDSTFERRHATLEHLVRRVAYPSSNDTPRSRD